MTASDTFDQDDDGIAFVIVDEVEPDSIDIIRSAVDACPSRAISIISR